MSLINPALVEHIESVNQKQPAVRSSTLINFVKAGAITQTKAPKKQDECNLLCRANDWKLQVDLPGHNYVFPPEIFSTSDHPDILM